MDKTPLLKGFMLAEWQIFPDQGVICQGDEKHHLEPKVMAVLVELACQQGEVVSRDQLINAIWETPFVTDEVLSRAISMLRKCFADDPKEPQFIQTVPKRGYRLISPVTLPEPESAPGSSQPATADSPAQPQIARTRHSPIIAAVLATLLLVTWFYDGNQGGPLTASDFADIGDWFDFLEKEQLGDNQMISLAVLPFQNLSEQPNGNYLPDSISDELIVALSKLPSLKVVARRTAHNMRNSPEDLRTIGRLLNVSAILEGTARITGEQLRISAQLSSTEDGFVLWTDTFERPLHEAADIRREIARQVTVTLGLADATSPMTLTGDIDSSAYQLFLNGRFFWKMRGEQPLRKSITLFRKALEIDPEFHRARIALAQALVLLPFYTNEDEQAMFRQAEAEIASLQLNDPQELAEVAALEGFIAQHSWRWLDAEEAFRRSLALAPDNANTYNWYSEFLGSVGRNSDAVTTIERGKLLDGVSPVINDRLGVAYMWANDDLRAAESFAAGAQLGFSNLINPGYLIFLMRLQRLNELRFVFEGIDTSTSWVYQNADMMIDPSRHPELIEIAAREQQAGNMLHPRLQFGFWVLFGDIDRAYQTFEQYRHTQKNYLQMELVFSREGKAFREDRRFRALVKEIGLSEYWQEIGEADFHRD